MEQWMYNVPFSNKHLLFDIQQIGIIAGGCVATPTQCSDIDVFVHDWEQWMLIQMKLQDHHSMYQARCLVSGYVQEEKKENISVIELKIQGEIVPMQIVFSEAFLPMDLIQGFDMDYTQAAIYKSQFFCTQSFSLVHQTKIVSQLRFPLTKDRLEKALYKGFAIPWMQSYDVTSKPQRWIDMPCFGLLDSFRNMSLVASPPEQNTISRIPILTAPYLLFVEKCSIINLQHRKTWQKKGKQTIHFFDFIVHCEKEIIVSSISLGGQIREVKKFDVIWFWLEGVHAVFRMKSQINNLQMGQNITCIVEASIHAKELRFEVQQIWISTETRIVPILIPSSFWSHSDHWYGDCTKIQTDIKIQKNRDWVQTRIKELEAFDSNTHKMEWIASMAYKALLFDNDYQNAAEQFALDVRKHLCSGKVQQDLGSDPFSRFALNGKFRVKLNSISSVVDFIEGQLKRGTPEKGIYSDYMLS